MEDVPDEIFDVFEISESESEVYCHCKSDVVADLVECDGPNCKIKFYHIRCVGLNVLMDDEPSDWVCYECLGQEKPILISEQEKKSSKPLKTKSSNTVREYAFTLEKAQENAKKLVLDTFRKLRSEGFCKLNVQLNDMLTLTVGKLRNSNAANDNCEKLIQHLWPSLIQADNNNQLISTRLEKKTVSFHQIRGSKDIELTFENFMTNLEIENCPTQICRFLLQFLIQNLFQELLKRRYSVSTTLGETAAPVHTLPATERQALRFTAGYICSKLSQNFAKYQTNPSNDLCWNILKHFKISESEVDTQNILSYTKEWLNIVSRGGFFSVSDPVYILFREMETIVRSNLDEFSSLLVTKDQLHQQIEDSESVNYAYMELVKDKDDESDDIEVYLLNRLIKCWMNIRLNAFANVCKYIKKKQETPLSPTSQKRMKRE
ncbi:unnamed protein product [Mytilus coruscus]|uniref:Zinc finger PHD-type domain-containing protein n=1 Tax=Mytilus coruscus TaxID=42192 RepID=A0A6J8AXC6_MYTCO|nr:unnamed protein product [Mytilus coruscus]